MKSFFRDKMDPLYIPPGGPGASAPPPALFEDMGEENIFRMLRDFYRLLGESSIAGMFPKDTDKASIKSAYFFVGLLGGEPLYHQRIGPPRMRMRHMPFRIDGEARKVWLSCFFKVLENHEDYGIPVVKVEALKEFLRGFSAWMVNTEPS